MASPASLLLAGALILGPPSVGAGVVVERVAEESPAERAGIRPGDTILTWSRAAGPPAAGSFETPFDLADVEIEQSPRGPVTLTGRRGADEISWTLPPVPFGLTTRPELEGPLLSLYEQGRDLVQSGKVAEGAERWREAARLAGERGGRVVAAWFLSRAAEALSRSGRPDEADAAYEAAVRAAEGTAPAGVVPYLLRRWGDSSRDRNDWPSTEERYLRALARSEQLDPGSLGTAQSLNRLGMLAWNRGDLVAAEEYGRRAFAIVERLAPGGLAFGESLNNLGLLSLERRDPDRAEEYYRRALAVGEAVAPESRGLAIVLVNLGETAKLRGDPKAAEAFLRRGLAVMERAAPGSSDLAWLLNSLGAAVRARGDLAAAEDYGQRALALQEKVEPDSAALAITLMDLGDVSLDRDDSSGAAERYERALAILEKMSPGSTEHAQALHALGTIRLRTNRVDDASAFFLRALDALESQGARLGGTQEARSGYAASFAAYYQDGIDTLLRLGRTAEALQVLERSRARLFLALLAERALDFAADIPPELKRERERTDAEFDRVQAMLGSLDPRERREEFEQLSGRLRELREAQQEISDRVRKASPRLASLQYARPLDLAGVRSALDPGTLLLSYSVGSERTLLFAVQDSSSAGPGLSVHTVPVGEATLRKKIEAFRRSIQLGPAVGLDVQAAELYYLLVRPVEAQVSASDRLLVSPDGPLHSLPFGALLRREGGRARPIRQYLIERKPLHVVASATVYAELKKSRREGGGAGRLVAFGDPRYPPYPKQAESRIENADVRAVVHEGFRLTPLPASRDEVEAIASLFPGRAQTYLGENATEERAKALGRDVRYVHFACHGSLDERFPLNSALALAIPARPAEGQDNGLLQAWEIFERVRIDADLVTLSACDTALGKEMGGEGLLGLTRAFQYAGARSVVASLWAVSDRSTGVLMKRFYGYLSAGRSTAEALRTAQIDLIRGPSSRPFRWAAFQLYGDWR
jgi:CHAT domain-containing protein